MRQPRFERGTYRPPFPHGSWRVRYGHGGVRSGQGLRPSSPARGTVSCTAPWLAAGSDAAPARTSIALFSLIKNCLDTAPGRPAVALVRRPAPAGLVHLQLTVGSARRNNELQEMGCKSPGRGRDGPRPCM